MKKTYKSKVDILLVLPVFLVMATVGFIIYSEDDTAGFILMIFLMALFVSMFYFIRYKIEGDVLKIYTSGILIKKCPISEIKSVSDTRSMLSSPAASLDRLDISLPKHGSVLVSPTDQSAFIRDLLSINPNIEVRRKNQALSK